MRLCGLTIPLPFRAVDFPEFRLVAVWLAREKAGDKWGERGAVFVVVTGFEGGARVVHRVVEN